MNFGASIHRVVGLDMADAVFEPGSSRNAHAVAAAPPAADGRAREVSGVLRLSYVADIESEALVERRIESMKKIIMALWDEQDGGYELEIEQEVFWRLGAAPAMPKEAKQ